MKLKSRLSFVLLSFSAVASLAATATVSASAGKPAKVTPTASTSKPTISWGFSNVASLPAGAKKRLMTENHYIYKMLQKELPEYQHSVFYGNVVRIEHEIKAGPRTCYPASSNAEERKHYSYLTPLYLGPELSLVMQKSLAQKLKNKSGRVSIKALLDQKNLTPVLAEARSYGSVLDKLIETERPDIRRNFFDPFSPSLIEILSHGRGDYGIEYDFIVQELLKSSDHKDVIVTAPIEELPTFNVIYLACSKTPEGLEIVKKVDQILRQHSNDPDYISSMVGAPVKGAANTEFSAAATAFVKTRGAGSVIR